MKKKAVSLLLAIVMLLSFVPTAAAAEEPMYEIDLSNTGALHQIGTVNLAETENLGNPLSTYLCEDSEDWAFVDNEQAKVYYCAVPYGTSTLKFTGIYGGLMMSGAYLYSTGKGVGKAEDNTPIWDTTYGKLLLCDKLAYDESYHNYFDITDETVDLSADNTYVFCLVGTDVDWDTYDMTAKAYTFIVHGEPCEHNTTAAHYEAVAPQCTVGGNIEYWICDQCGQYFSDAAKTQTITAAQSRLPVLGHNSEGNTDAVCKNCGKKVFTAQANGAVLDQITFTPNAYYYTNFAGEKETAGLYTISIPAETDTVDFSFCENVLAYNYQGPDAYLNGVYSFNLSDPVNYTTGDTKATLPVDFGTDSMPADGQLDYIQVQNPYHTDYTGAELLYAITFRYANAGAGGGNGTETMGTEISDAYAATKKLLSDRMSGYVWGGGTSNSDDWDAFGLARDGVNIPQSYYESVVAAVQENKLTGDARSILTLMAAGYDPATVNGTDLMKALADQVDAADSNCGFGAWGIYSIPWVLIALNNDRAAYKTPCSALMNWLVNNQKESGAWGYQSDDVDLTAEAISALAPYYTSNRKVKAAVDRALTWLAAQQKEDGSFHYNGAPSVESTSQVVVALTDLGIDPTSWNDKDAVSAMCTMALPAGGFTYGGSYNEISTYEGFYALVAYYRFLTGQSSLYDMSDVALHEDGHVLGAYQRNADEHWKECAVCHAVFDKAAHIYDSGKVTTPATCTATGIKTYTCTKCGATKTETINAAGHNWTNATCTTPATCSRCGVTNGTALGHNYINGRCNVCNDPNPAAVITLENAEKYVKVNEENRKAFADAVTGGTLVAQPAAKVVDPTADPVVGAEVETIKANAAFTARGAEVKMVLDLSVKLSDGTVELGTMPETAAPIRFSVTLPSDVLCTIPANKDVALFYDHNGTVGFISADSFNRTTGELKFYADKFSTYTVVTVNRQTHYDPPAHRDTQSPRTADSGILLYGALSVMSLLGMGYVGKKRR